jgi:SPP1 family predicted phage head-tail adaptor
MNKKIGKLKNVIYFEENIENSSLQDGMGGFVSLWIPALEEVVVTAEADTTTTVVHSHGHKVLVGDYIINVTRNNAVRKVIDIHAHDFTLESAITGQTQGDTIKQRLYSHSKVWANIKPKIQLPYNEEQKKLTFVTHTIEIRYRTDITAEMRIKFGNRYFEILSIINPDEAKERLVLECRELII